MFDSSSLVEKLKPLNPQRIILFGSYAKGTMGKDSDIDVLIIKDTDKRPIDRIAEVMPLIWGNIPHIEPQVLTPQEFEQAIRENRFFITQEVLKYGKVIYEEQ